MPTLLTGTFQGVYPVAPYGYFRSLTIETREGIAPQEHSFQVGFKKIEEQTKGIKKGDKVEIKYQDYDNFTIRKI